MRHARRSSLLPNVDRPISRSLRRSTGDEGASITEGSSSTTQRAGRVVSYAPACKTRIYRTCRLLPVQSDYQSVDDSGRDTSRPNTSSPSWTDSRLYGRWAAQPCTALNYRLPRYPWKIGAGEPSCRTLAPSFALKDRSPE